MSIHQDNIEWEDNDEEYLRTHVFVQRPYGWTAWNRFNPSSPYFWPSCAIYIGCWLAMGLMSIMTGLYGFHMVDWVFVHTGILYTINAAVIGLIYLYLYYRSEDAHARVEAVRERWHRERAHRNG
jgi:hypothetical protein